MANVFSIVPYLTNSGPALSPSNAIQIGLPTTGVMVTDCTNSPTRSLSTGVNVYTEITVLATGTRYYVSQTYAQIISLIG